MGAGTAAAAATAVAATAIARCSSNYHRQRKQLVGEEKTSTSFALFLRAGGVPTLHTHTWDGRYD